MNYDSPELEEAKILRIKSLRTRVQGLEKDLIKEVDRAYEEILKNRRYAKYQSKLNHRVRLSENFTKCISTFFFDMLHDCEYLYLTPEVEIFQRIEKFKKTVMKSVKKITENIEEDGKPKERKITESDEEADENEEDNKEEAEKKKGSRKGRNSKIPTEQSWKLTEWLVQHFHYPYPSTESKEELAKDTGLSEQKVTNWFINVREREWKPYFPK